MIIDASFEKISKYADDDGVIIPERKTTGSAGYDFCAAEDTVILPYDDLIDVNFGNQLRQKVTAEFESYEEWEKTIPYTLGYSAELVKMFNARIPMVPTGIKCKIPEGYFLELSVRSSLPRNHWLIMGNSIGIIDADYYNNPDNEGHIFFQLINLLPIPIKILKGECFGQGVLKPFCVCENEKAIITTRTGGFGSTSV